MARKDEWTPYGLEAIRIAHLRRRRILGALAILGLFALLLLLTDTTTTKELDISVNGRQGNGISLDVPDEQPRDGPVTVSLSPGRVTRAEAGQAAQQDTITRNAAPTFSRAAPYNFGNVLLLLAPWALLALGAWFLGKRRSRHDEVNYGVYKGTMPLEMITASASRQVFTKRHARSSLFGRKPVDHLPPEVIASHRSTEEDP